MAKSMKFHACRVALAVAICAASGAWAETLYVATLRDYSNKDTGGLGGALYSVDSNNGKSTLLAPLRVGGAIPIGITGLAIHPKTGVFYGITAALSAQIPRSLVTIDPKTGNTTLVGSLNHEGSDIRFDGKGTLYVWLNDPPGLGTIDLGTGASTPIGTSGYTDSLGGGLAIDRSGDFYVSATNAAGTLDRVNLADGRVTVGPRIAGAPYLSSINSMAFSPAGVLHAVNSNLGAPAKSALIAIDPKTGVVKELGPLPNDVDPLAFAPSSLAAATEEPAVKLWMLVAVAMAAGIVLGYGLALVSRRRA
jgi:hypothetical protein